MATPKEVSVIVRAIDQVTSPLKEMNTRIGGFVDGVKSMFAAIGATAVALAIGNFLKGVVEKAEASEKSTDALRVALHNVGLEYDQLSPQIDANLDAIQRHTIYSKNDARAALVALISITGDYNKSLSLMGLAEDVAAFRHVTLAEAAVTVGKANNGVLKGLGDLGVTTKHAGEALDQMRATVSGFAESEGKSFGGRVEILNNLWDDFKTKVGLAIIGNKDLGGSLDGLATVLVDLAGWVQKNSDGISSAVTGIVEFFKGAIAALKTFVGPVEAAWKAIATPALWYSKLMKDKNKEQTDDVKQTQQSQTATVKTEGTKRVVLTKEQQAAIDKADAEAKAAGIAAAKKHHEDLLKLQDEAHKSTLSLLDAHEAAYQGAIDAANKVIVGMTSADQAAAKAALKTHLDNMLLARAGFTDAVLSEESRYVEGGHPMLEFQKSEQTGILDLKGVTLDFTQVLKDHGETVSADQQKYILDKLAHDEWKQSIADSAFDVEDLSNKFLQMADAAGVATPELKAMFGGITDIADGIGRIASGDVLGGITAGLGGIKSIVGMFTGESASARFVRLALEKNSQKLEESSKAIGDLTTLNTPGGKLAGVQGALADFFKDPGAIRRDRHGVPIGIDDKALTKSLLGHGMGVDDLDKLAKDLGISIRDDKGKLVGKMLQQLLEEIGALEPTDYAHTFAGQKKHLGDETTLFGLSPQEQAKNLANLASDSVLGSPVLAAALAKADFTTAAGRAAVTQIIKDLFTQLPNLKAADLGGLSGQDFVDVLKELMGFLSSMAQSTGSPAPSVGADTGGLGVGVPAGPAAGLDFSDLFAVQVAARDILKDVRRDVHAMAGSGSSVKSIDASITGLTVNVNVQGGGGSIDPSAIAQAVSQGVTAAHNSQVDVIQQALAKDVKSALLATGNITRSAPVPVPGGGFSVSL